MSTYSYNADRNYGLTAGETAGAAGTTVVMFASPFIATAAVNGFIYGAPVMSSANALIPAGMIAGNMVYPGIGGLAGGIAAASYGAGYPLTRALVIGVGAGLVEVAIGLVLLELWVKGESNK